MKMSKVGNQTNSQDPQAVNSRVFVGNLNTFQCSKTDVERMFQRYGRLAGISMHKGYAFVQFTNPFDARSACLGEDGRTILSQVLDVNLVAEPKAHQTGRKRQNVNKTGNDWDYYYDSYYATTTLPTLVPRVVGPPVKRPRLMLTINKSNKILSPPQTEKIAENSTNNDQLKKYSNPDILICGNCRELFTEIHDLLEHKKSYCKLRFTCKCRVANGCSDNNNYSPDIENSHASLLCLHCNDSFQSAWDLMVHVQAVHTINIYTISKPSEQLGEEHSPQINECSNGTNDKHDELQEESNSNSSCCASDKEEELLSKQDSIHDNEIELYPVVG